MNSPLSSDEWIDFNINHKVRVQLTDAGRAALKKGHADLFGPIAFKHPWTPPEEDAEGWSKWQLWDLMQQLGHRCFMGGPVPFYTTIQIQVRGHD